MDTGPAETCKKGHMDHDLSMALGAVVGLVEETLCETACRQLAETARPIRSTYSLINLVSRVVRIPRHLHAGILD